MTNRFGMLVFWNDYSLIHPDDVADLIKHCPGGRCFVFFEELGREKEYLILPVKGQSFRVKPEALREYEPTHFVVGQKVKTVTGTLRTGWIYEISWHFKNKRHIYLLEVEVGDNQRNKLTRYYGEEDLETA